MLFNSPIFLFAFLPATVGLYIVLRQFAGPRAVLGMLIAASVFFYGWWNPYYLLLVIYSTLLDYGLVTFMDHCPRDSPKMDLRARLTRLTP